MNKNPHKAGQPQPQGLRATPTSIQTREGQPSPRERSPTHSQEKEGPNNPREGRGIPFPRVEGHICQFLYNNYGHEPSHPHQEGRANPNFKPPLLLGRAWPLPFLLAGPLAFPFSLFGWPSPWGLANLDPKGQPRPQEGRANPHPEKEGGPLPREGKANPTGQPQTGKGRGNPRSENCQHLRKGQPSPKSGKRQPNPKEEGPTPGPAQKEGLADNYHCVIVIKIPFVSI